MGIQQVQYSFQGETRTLEYTEGDPGKPVILLLHGAGGNIVHMTAPDSPLMSPHVNYDYTLPFPPDRDEGWSYYPGIGVWSFELDPFKQPLTSWREILGNFGFATAAYSQVNADGFLELPVEELVVVVGTLKKIFPETPLVFLAHSRGGLLARKFLKDHGNLVPNLTKVITLDSPHQGSRLANIANAVSATITGLKNAVGPTIAALIDDALGWLESTVTQDAWQELAENSQFLRDLQNGEVPLPGVQYFTFGGISVRLVRIRSWVYTIGSSLPQWHWPPFHHVITLVEVPLISPLADSVPPLTDEIASGQGDLLTADIDCRLPFAVHQTNAINHPECLWNGTLQDQVLRILGQDISIWG